jgi:hypothetical protein
MFSLHESRAGMASHVRNNFNLKKTKQNKRLKAILYLNILRPSEKIKRPNSKSAAALFSIFFPNFFCLHFS